MIQLHLLDGVTIWVNVRHILSVAPADEGVVGRCTVVLGIGQKIIVKEGKDTLAKEVHRIMMEVG